MYIYVKLLPVVDGTCRSLSIHFILVCQIKAVSYCLLTLSSQAGESLYIVQKHLKSMQNVHFRCSAYVYCARVAREFFQQLLSMPSMRVWRTISCIVVERLSMLRLWSTISYIVGGLLSMPKV